MDNWNKSDLIKFIEESKKDGKDTVYINQENADFLNPYEVRIWLTEIGLNFVSDDTGTTVLLNRG